MRISAFLPQLVGLRLDAVAVDEDGLTVAVHASRRLAVCLRHLGESTELGPYPARTELILGLAPPGFCAAPAPRASTGPVVRVTRPALGVWGAWWRTSGRTGRGTTTTWWCGSWPPALPAGGAFSVSGTTQEWRSLLAASKYPHRCRLR